MKHIKSWLQLWWPVQAASMLLIITNWLANRYQVSALDLPVPFLLVTVAAVLVTAVFYRAWRRRPLVGLVGALAAALVLTSDFESRLSAVEPLIRAVNPIARLESLERPVFALLFIGLVLLGAYWLGRLAERVVARFRWSSRDWVRGAQAMIAVTFAFQVVPTAGYLAESWPQFFYRPASLPAAPATAKSANKPDIFYIVLDRYASADVLKSQFGYDNSEFLNYLRADGFYVNDSALNNYPYTSMSISSTMAANYQNDIISKFAKSDAQTTVPYNLAVQNSPVAERLKSLGYKYDLVGNWYETSNYSPLADVSYVENGKLTLFGRDIILGNYAKNQLTQSVFWRLVPWGAKIGDTTVVGYSNKGDVDMHKYALGALKDLADDPAGGRFVFAHILLPHDPYYFNADGSLSNNVSNDNYGKTIKHKYLDQLEYVNSQMRDVLERIKKAGGGKSVVVLQADEGPYPFDLNREEFSGDIESEVLTGDMAKWSDASLRMKYGNLAAYYVPKAEFDGAAGAAAGAGAAGADADAADNVNIFRLVLNRYFGYSLPILPDCYYAYPNGRDKPEVFSEITRRLTDGAADSRCGADGLVK